MLATAIVIFREVLEAALIIGIVLAAARGVLGRGRWVGGGIIAGLVCALLVAVFAQNLSEMAEGVGQEVFNAGVLFAAVLMLGWHNIWMSSHGRAIARQMKALGAAVAAGDRPIYALAIVVGLAVLREGSEVVLFLHGIAAIAQENSVMAMLAGSAIGLAGGVVTGFIIYFGLIRLPTQQMFTVTEWLILFLAAGMAGQGAGYLAQAGVLPALGEALWDTSWLLSEDSLLGHTLHVLVGYEARPAGIQLVFYLVALLGIAAGMRLFGRAELEFASEAKNRIVAIFAFLLLWPTVVSAHHKVYYPIVEEGAVELEYRGHRTNDDRADEDNAQRHRFEVGYSPFARWHSSVFVDLENTPERELDYRSFGWENIIQLFEQGEYWLDAGLYLEYVAKGRHRNDVVEGKILLQKPVGSLYNTANVIFEVEKGSDPEPGVEFGYAWQTKWRWLPLFEPGFEAFGELGRIDDIAPIEEQEHNIGPAIFGAVGLQSLPGKLKYRLGYLFGLTEGSADGLAKFDLEYEFYWFPF